MQVLSHGSRTTAHGYSGGVNYGDLLQAQVEAKEHLLDKKREQIDTRTQSIGSILNLRSEAMKLLAMARDVTGSLDKDSPRPPCFHDYEIHIGNPDTRKKDNYYLDIKTDGRPARKEFNINVNSVATQSRWRSVEFDSLDTTFTTLNSRSGSMGMESSATNDRRVITLRKTDSNGTLNHVEIEVTANDNLSSLKQKINNAKCDVEAYTHKTGNGRYVLEFISKDTGTINDIESLIDPLESNALNAGLFFPNDSAHRIQAQNSEIVIDGEMFMSAKRTMSGEDIGLTGVILTLRNGQQKGEDPISVSMSPNIKEAAEKVVNFINQYNEFALQLGRQRTIKPDNELDPDSRDPEKQALYRAEKAKLGANNELINGLYSNIFRSVNAIIENNPLATIFGGADSRGLGLKPVQIIDNGEPLNAVQITGHGNTMHNKLLENFDAVAKLFMYEFSTTSSHFTMDKKGTQLNDIKEFNIQFDGSSDDDIVTISYRLPGDSQDRSFQANVRRLEHIYTIDIRDEDIKRNPDAARFKGCRFQYTGPENAVIDSTMHMSHGIADLIANNIESFTEKQHPHPLGHSDLVDKFELERLKKSDDNDKDKEYIKKKQEEFEKERERWLRKYAVAEAKASMYESTQQTLEAWSNAYNNK